MPCRGRERAAALGSEALRAIERAGGMETGERLLVYSARPAPFSATPDGATLRAILPVLSVRQSRQILFAVRR